MGNMEVRAGPAFHVGGKIKEIIFAQFGPNEDLLQGILAVAKDRDIQAGVVLSIVGGLTNASIHHPAHPGPIETTPVQHFEIPGPMEVSGQGILGLNDDGSPYAHIHISVTNGETSIMGHLEEGSRVRALSLLPKSHFTIVLASVEGIRFTNVRDHDLAKKYPDRFPAGANWHELVEI